MGVIQPPSQPQQAFQQTTAHTLATKGVRTMDDLADLAIDELTEMTGMDAERAKTLIMTARAPWFAEKPAVVVAAADAAVVTVAE